MNTLSKREIIAALAMQGHCANPHEEIRTASSDQLARWAVECADALIAEGKVREHINFRTGRRTFFRA